MYKHKKKELINIAQQMNKDGINTGTSGNISFRTEQGFFITPSGIPYEQLDESDLVLVTEDGYEGKNFPSSEWRLHKDIMNNRADVQVIIHSHPPYCSALSSCRKSLPPFHYMIVAGGGKEIPCADYALFGTQELSDNTIRYLESYNAVLMSNHGIVCVGDSLSSTYTLISTIENLARQYAIACSYGDVVLLTDEEIDQVLMNFLYYGKQEEEIIKLGLDPKKNLLTFPKKIIL